MRDAFRRYLQSRLSLEEPEAVFTALSRREALALARALGRDAPPGRSSRAAEGAGADGEAATEGEVALPAPEVERLRREGEAEEIRGLPDLSTVRAVAEGCLRCRLHAGRRHVVFGEGDSRARVVCVGEAPGAVEDETGRPFVGPAGKLLDRLLLSAGFPREDVYICNVLKCRPPGNRNPREDEIEACSPYLLRQLDLIEPKVIVAFGTFAARTLLGIRDSLGRMRGRTHVFRGYPVVVTYHPAALLRNRGWTRPTWEDLQRVRALADGDAEARGRREAGAAGQTAERDLFA